MAERKQFNTSITETARGQLARLAEERGVSRDRLVEELLKDYADGAPTTQPEDWVRVPFRIDGDVLEAAQAEAKRRGEKLSEALRQRIAAVFGDTG
ncbi:hypothetical protein [Nocardioides sp. Kera G14]|uniref:hypothetical protein n=1 Tax=Nocardioides sp. Kera G14 TaxID=2884264 RepID=UPI001D10A86D|nr:hypothetical protein [Nocardioides sp. Kera G14]UDY23819.1 hypothetical protein LH076_00545 [Nocardioides sp. Kera G14]